MTNMTPGKQNNNSMVLAKSQIKGPNGAMPHFDQRASADVPTNSRHVNIVKKSVLSSASKEPVYADNPSALRINKNNSETSNKNAIMAIQ